MAPTTPPAELLPRPGCPPFSAQAQEILKSSRGALMWHGRDMRHFKRILAPPLQQLLVQPGCAVLGRGLASMPAEAAHQMGAAQVGLPCLGVVGLCCLLLPLHSAAPACGTTGPCH